MLLEFGPSQRALAAASEGPAWDMMESYKPVPRYDPDSCPEGLIDLSGAVNGLMGDWMARFIAESPEIRQEWLSYGAIAGSEGLRRAAAGFFNRYFDPDPLITGDDIIAANGVTSLIDLMAWTLCDPGDAVLYPTPNFYMLDCDLRTRAAVQTVPFSTSSLPDPFADDAAQAMVELAEAAARGFERRDGRHQCKILFLCNPANPQGRCWSPVTIRALGMWCARRGMHLVVDEIYAMSDFSKDTTSRFRSCLSVIGDGVLRQNVHCLYGLSKDFGMGGLRVGFLVTQNKAIRKATLEAT
jgi:aspartate/methionine/tyrosine aminotransferase